MTPTEALTVLRKLTAYQPGTRIDDLTAQAWAEALHPYDQLDALGAVTQLASDPRPDGAPFAIELRDIIGACRAAQRRRLTERRHQLPDPPAEVADDPAAYQAWWADTCRAASARDWTPPAALEAGRHDARPAITALADVWTPEENR